MIKPITLGNKAFPINIIQGPLAGVSCAPFRELIWRYSKPAFSCTEMISCKTLIHSSDNIKKRYIKKSPDEGPVCFQIAGSEPGEVAQATKIVMDYGADMIDLNCGCPVKKIRSKGAGSSLLMNPSMLYKLISAMKANTSVPVSIKIRVQGNSGDSFNQEIATVVQDAGANFLVVHGRHWNEQYETPCRYEDIQFFVNELNIPVIGNGDIACIDSLKKMLTTGCAGVMIGRASVGQPWLIGQLNAEINQEKFILPSLKEVGNMFIEHVQQLALLLGSEKFAIIQARKFSKYYARKLENKINFCDIMNRCDNFQYFQEICRQYFG